jgi:hypothetical protein
MFEATKSRRVTPELAALIPTEATDGIWAQLDLMLEHRAIVDTHVQVWFADDFTPQEIYIMFVQEHALPQHQELVMPYTGNTDWLGKGLMVMIDDTDDESVMDINPINLDESEEDWSIEN